MKYLISGLLKYTAASILVVSLVACGGAEERKVKYLEKGKAYLADKNYDKAKIEIKNVLQIDPKFAEAYFIMGQIEELNKEYGRALGLYKKAIELNPDYNLAKVKLSKIYVIAGTNDFIEEAKKLLADVKKVEPENSEVDLILATIDYKTGSKNKAISALEKVVAKNKNLEDGISLLATLYVSDERENEAVKLLTKGVSDNSGNIPLRIFLAKLLAKNKNIVEAEKYLKQAISIDPEKYSLQFALSSFYSSSNQDDKAEAVLRKSIEQNEEDAQRYLVLVEFLASRVSAKKGAEELEKAIKNKPELYSLKFAQVQFYEKLGKIDKIKEVLNQIIAEKSYEVEGVRARILMAKYLLNEGDQSGAKVYVDEVIEEYPNNNDALLIISKLALINVDAITAINGLRTVVKNDPKNAEASLLLAQAHELNNESSLAENELKKAIEVNPVNDQVHANYARYLSSKGRVDEAISVIDKALTYFKDNYQLMDIKLKILASQGKESEVVSLLNIMEQANESNAEVNITKGQYHLSKREIPQAIEQFESAYQKSQNKFKPLQLIVKSYMVNNQPEKAQERLQKILDKTPDDPVSNLLMGQLYLVQKKTAEARKMFTKASKAAENWLPPYTSLAASYMAENDPNKALDIYQSALTKLKNKVPVLMQMAAIYERQGNFAKAMETYKTILVENPTNKLVANNYASLLLDHGKESDSSKALELAKGFEKLQQPALQDTLGWAYAKTGDSAKAVEILKPIVEKAPKIAVFRYHLGFALYSLGDKAAAKSHLEIATASKQNFPGKDKATELLKSI